MNWLALGTAQLGSRSGSARYLAHCSSGLGSPRLGSARLATRGSVHLGSWVRLGLRLRLCALESTRCSARLSSELDTASTGAQLNSIVISSGLTTHDSTWLGSGLRSAHLDNILAQLILAIGSSRLANSYQTNNGPSRTDPAEIQPSSEPCANPETRSKPRIQAKSITELSCTSSQAGKSYRV